MFICFVSATSVCAALFQMQVPPTAQNKIIYFLKKRCDPIDSDNYRGLLLFGLLSPSPLLQLASTVEQVTVIHPPPPLSSSHTCPTKKAFCCICSKLFLFLASGSFKVILCLFVRYASHCCQTTKTTRCGPTCCPKISSDTWRACAV